MFRVNVVQTQFFTNKCRPIYAANVLSRSFSSGSSSSIVRDRRLAGRRRFYRNVGIKSLSSEQAAPWRLSERQPDQTVKSPITAGVDGTNSASGVHHLKSSKNENNENNNNIHSLGNKNLEHYLTPRKPWLETLPSGNDEVSTAPAQDLSWYGITLDDRLIQTPMGQTVVVPSEMFAAQIAAEWDNVEHFLQPTQMPCMTLACTVLDQTASHPHIYQDQIIRFVSTDTVCYWADPTEDRVLHQRQEQAWRKIHNRVQQVAGAPLASVIGAQEGMMTAARGLPHDPRLFEYAKEFTHSLDAWHLTLLQSLAVEAKSFWLAWALLTQRYHKDTTINKDNNNGDNVQLPLLFSEVSDAVQASRVEEEFQISNWGLVEGQHDYDRLNASINVSAALMLADSLAVDCNL